MHDPYISFLSRTLSRMWDQAQRSVLSTSQRRWHFIEGRYSAVLVPSIDIVSNAAPLHASNNSFQLYLRQAPPAVATLIARSIESEQGL
jgi:hypothetical protein